MNQATHAVSVSVAVITNTNEMVKELIASKNYSGSTPMTESVNDVFAIGLEQADYIAPESMFNMSDFGNGTGYYDPLMTVGFEDESGKPVPNFSSVAIRDPKTKRRLYLIVLARGRNIIIHDRFTQNENTRGTTLVATGCSGTRLLNMNPAWSENVHDLMASAAVFGLEFDKRSNSVYIPKWRKENWFKDVGSMLNF